MQSKDVGDQVCVSVKSVNKGEEENFFPRMREAYVENFLQESQVNWEVLLLCVTYAIVAPIRPPMQARENMSGKTETIAFLLSCDLEGCIVDDGGLGFSPLDSGFASRHNTTRRNARDLVYDRYSR